MVGIANLRPRVAVAMLAIPVLAGCGGDGSGRGGSDAGDDVAASSSTGGDPGAGGNRTGSGGNTAAGGGSSIGSGGRQSTGGAAAGGANVGGANVGGAPTGTGGGPVGIGGASPGAGGGGAVCSQADSNGFFSSCAPCLDSTNCDSVNGRTACGCSSSGCPCGLRCGSYQVAPGVSVGGICVR